MTQNLPAYLQQYQAPDVGAALSQNLGSPLPPRVSIEGGRFTLIDASNNEIPVPTFDPTIGVYLDAAIIDVNNVLSRIYYRQGYDNQGQGVRPDCFSDNGVAPSTHAGSPQARSCTPDPEGVYGCKMAVWGSKINSNGKGIPACTQKQKMALLIPGFPTLFLLAVPPNSFSYLGQYLERAKGYQINLANVITRISFVPGVQGTLLFAPSPAGYIDEPTAKLRQAAYAEKKTDALVGRNDVARPAGAIASPTQPADAGAFVQGQVLVAQHGVVNQPAPFVPPTTSPAPNAAWPGPGQQSPAPTAATASPSEAPRRRRRTQAEIQAANGAPADQPPATGAPVQQQAPFPHPGQQAPQQAAGTAPQGQFPQSAQPGALPGHTDMGFGMAQGQPATANPELSTMLDDFFKA